MKQTIDELKKMIAAAPLLEPPAGDIVADLAQQLIDVQERLNSTLPDTMYSVHRGAPIYNSQREDFDLPDDEQFIPPAGDGGSDFC